MANFFEQFDQTPPSDVGQDRPIPRMGHETPDNYFAQFDNPPSLVDWTDIGEAVKAKGVQGLYNLAATPGNLDAVMNKGANWVNRQFGLPEHERLGKTLEKKKLLPPGGLPTGQEMQQQVETWFPQIAVPDYEPMTALGRVAGEAAGLAPTAATIGLGGVGSLGQAVARLPGSIAKYAVVPAVTGEVAAQTATKLGVPQWAEGARMAGELGGMMGASALRHVATPFPAEPGRIAAADRLAQEGVTDLTAGQRVGSIGLRNLESELGGARAQGMAARQGEQFTSAVLRRAGIDAPRATPEVIDHAFDRIGGEFDRLSTGNTLNLDRRFGADLRNAFNGYARRVQPPNRMPLILDYGQEIQSLAAAGPIPGDVYQSLRSRIGADVRGTRDPYASHALSDMQHALDDAMERSIARTNPADLGAFREARRQYRNMLVIERAATGAGETAASDIITPAQLRAATVALQGRRGYARGQGEFSDLARSGVRVMSPLPQSGKAGRTAARNLGVGILGAGIAGAATGNPWAAMAGAAAASALPYGVGRAALSGRGRAYLSNQVFLPRPDAATTNALMGTEMLLRPKGDAVPLELPGGNDPFALSPP